MHPIRFLADLLRTLAGDRRGATAVEYGFIITLIVIAMFVSLRAFADTAIGMWDHVAHEVVTKSQTRS